MLVPVVVLLATAASAATPAQNRQAAAEHYRQATAAFGLGHYAEAAQQYEQAFALVPDHALLFNAALSHERAGNGERARTLFANYLRLYAKGEKAPDAKRHLEQLASKAEAQAAPEPKAADKVETATQEPAPVVASPSAPTPSSTEAPAAAATTPEASPGEPRAVPVVAPPIASSSAGASPPPSRPELLTLPQESHADRATASSERPLWKNPWLWGATALVVGLVVTAGILVSRPQSSSPPLWGRI